MGNQLHLGLWGGDLKIENVRLKRTAFHSLLNKWKKDKCSYDFNTLTLKLVHGSIGYLRIRLPWKQLILGAKNTEVRIELHDVMISLGFDHSTKKSSNDAYPRIKNKNLRYHKITETHNLQESHKQHLIRELQLWLDGTIKD